MSTLQQFALAYTLLACATWVFMIPMARSHYLRNIERYKSSSRRKDRIKKPSASSHLAFNALLSAIWPGVWLIALLCVLEEVKDEWLDPLGHYFLTGEWDNS